MALQPDKFTLVAGEFLSSGAALHLDVSQNWPELLRWSDGRWERKPAEGFNVFNLMQAGDDRNYTSPFWLTLKDGEAAGGRLREGARGVTIALWRWSVKTGEWEGDISPQNIEEIAAALEDADDEDPAVGMRPAVVFNAQEWERLETPAFEPRRLPTPDEALQKAQAVEERGAGCEIRHAGTVAYYNPSLNYICVPAKETMRAKAYYWLLFEQIGHALAGRHQLDFFSRKIEAGVAREPSFRVLYAKMVAAALAYETGIDVLD